MVNAAPQNALPKRKENGRRVKCIKAISERLQRRTFNVTPPLPDRQRDSRRCDSGASNATRTRPTSAMHKDNLNSLFRATSFRLWVILFFFSFNGAQEALAAFEVH